MSRYASTGYLTAEPPRFLPTPPQQQQQRRPLVPFDQVGRAKLENEVFVAGPRRSRHGRKRLFLASKRTASAAAAPEEPDRVVREEVEEKAKESSTDGAESESETAAAVDRAEEKEERHVEYPAAKMVSRKRSNKVRVVSGRVRVRVPGFPGTQGIAPSAIIKHVPASKVRAAAKRVLMATKKGRRRGRRVAKGRRRRRRRGTGKRRRTRRKRRR